MITFTLVPRALSQLELDDFLKSLSYSHSGSHQYEVISEKDSEMFKEKGIARVTSPSADSVINITTPDDLLVLGNSWDKYIMYAVENGLPQYGPGKDYVPDWLNYIPRRMGFENRRPPIGIYPDLKVVLATR